MTDISCGELYIGNSLDVKITGLSDSDGEYIDNATCSVTLKDAEGTVVTGASGLSMAYITDSDGDYLGVLPSTLSLTVDDTYYLEVTATSDDVGVGFWRVELVAKYRKAS